MPKQVRHDPGLLNKKKTSHPELVSLLSGKNLLKNFYRTAGSQMAAIFSFLKNIFQYIEAINSLQD
jgi:hypothetical protein